MFGDTANDPRDEARDTDIPVEKRAVGDLRAEFVALATQPRAKQRRCAAASGLRWPGRASDCTATRCQGPRACNAARGGRGGVRGGRPPQSCRRRLHQPRDPALPRGPEPRAPGRPAARRSAVRAAVPQRPVVDRFQSRSALRAGPLSSAHDPRRPLAPCPRLGSLPQSARRRCVHAGLMPPASARGCPTGSRSTTAVPGVTAWPILLNVWLRRLSVAVSHSRP